MCFVSLGSIAWSPEFGCPVLCVKALERIVIPGPHELVVDDGVGWMFTSISMLAICQKIHENE